MSRFDAAIRRIEQYRICLERDVAAGIIADSARETVDECFRTLETVLRSTRVELEGAGPSLSVDRAFGDHFVSGCSMLALRMFRLMYREGDSERLHLGAAAIRSEGRALIEHLWARLETVAA